MVLFYRTVTASEVCSEPADGASPRCYQRLSTNQRTSYSPGRWTVTVNDQIPRTGAFEASAWAVSTREISPGMMRPFVNRYGKYKLLGDQDLKRISHLFADESRWKDKYLNSGSFNSFNCCLVPHIVFKKVDPLHTFNPFTGEY